MHIIDAIGITVVGLYLSLVAASNKNVRGVVRVSTKTVKNSFMLAERAYDRYVDDDEETEVLLSEIKKKVKRVKVKPIQTTHKEPGEHEFIL